MPDAVLVLNAGSSSLKFSVFQTERGERRLMAHGQVEGIGSTPRFVFHDQASGGNEPPDNQSPSGCSGPPLGKGLDHEQALQLVLDCCKKRFSGFRLIAVGHRVVHGGMTFTQPVTISQSSLAELERLVPFDPLHLPSNIAVIRATMQSMPAIPQVACFDTAFHHNQPKVAQLFGLPRRFTDEGIKRYGFHGLSYEYIASVLPGIDSRAAEGRTIVAHLGNGASMCALLGGKSVATTMSFTPVDGLVMGTRVGSLDPAAMLYLMTQYGMDAHALEKLIYHDSGLLGVSGISSDMRDLLTSKDPHAAEAIELFVYRIAREIGSLAASLGGLDALVFTGGIGENAPPIRAQVCLAARWLGVELDEAANARGGPCISRAGSGTTAWVIPTNEELMIVEHIQQVLRAN